MPRLIFTRGKHTGDEIEVGEQSLTLGRHATADVTVDDTKVSRSHARVECENGVYFVVDLDSANGTRVNGRAVRRQRLYGGDAIGVGTTEIRFRQDVARARPVAALAPAGGPGGGPGPGSRGASAVDEAEPEIRLRDEPLQFSPHRNERDRGFAFQDLGQEGGPLRWIVLLVGFVLLAGIALLTTWIVRGMV